MLIDDLLNNKLWTEAGVITPIRKRLEKAPKFVLRRDFAIAVDELVHRNWNDTRDKIVPLCRLPYPDCWIELAHADRLAFKVGLPLRPYECPVKRIGWLLTELDKSGSWKAEMFWSFDQKNGTYQTYNNEVNSLRKSMLWAKAPFSAAMITMGFHPQASTADEAWGPYGLSTFALFTETRDQTYARRPDHPGNLTDWEGEGTFLMGVLALLNSKNVVERTSVSFARKNKAAAKAGQLPLFDHHVISIHRRYTKRNMDQATVSDGHKFRAHFVRGHFKARKTGIFFWSAFRRGNLTLGFTHKDYKVDL